MASRIPKQYKEMLREAYKDGSVPTNTDRPLKRRRKSRSRTPTSPASNNSSREFTPDHKKRDKGRNDYSRTPKIENTPLSEVAESKDRILTGPNAILQLSGGEIKIEAKQGSLSSSRDQSQDVVSLVSSDESDGGKQWPQQSPGTLETNGLENVIVLDDDDDEAEDDDDDEFDDDDFEDVDISGNQAHPYNFDTPKEKDEINVVLKKPLTQPSSKKKKANRDNVITTEEKTYRKNMHMMYLACMVAHGVIRNSWSSDSILMRNLRTSVPKNIIDDLIEYRLVSRSDNSVQSKTRKLLDLLKRIMIFWYKSFTISGGEMLIKHLWVEFGKKEKTSSKVSKEKFVKLIGRRRGSRQVAVQGFVSLLRSLGLQCRLIFSIQPPDFTNMQRDDLNQDQDEDSTNTSRLNSPKPQLRGSASSKRELSSSEKIFQALRVTKSTYSNSKMVFSSDKEIKYPIMWCEVWDKDAKKWITIDPITQKKIEVVAGKSCLEPPLNDPHNNTFYVISYDNYGGVRDVTRRYSQQYNAKVRKKRITRESEGELWWDKLLLAANTDKGRKLRNIDIVEKHEFETRSLEEGMPNSIQDFKGHPIYVLEEHLRQNEILHPKISRGTIRKKSAKGGLTPVYARKYVHIVRSAKAWYLRGRVLKMAERPMKVRENKPKPKKGRKYEDDYRLSDNDGDFDDEDDVNLYAEFQTELYVPPPIVDGKIPVNAYGNIDIYTKSMIPKGATHIEGKFASKAAKLIGVEYVNAVTGFDFTGGGSKSRGSGIASAKINGVVVLDENAEAVKVVSEYLEEQEIEDNQKRQELIALRGWKVLLSKLRIQERLNSEHGVIPHISDESESESPEQPSREKFKSRIYDYDFDESDIDTKPQRSDISQPPNHTTAYGGGGFLVDHNDEELNFSADDIDDMDEASSVGLGPIDVDDHEDDVDDNPSHYGVYDFGDSEESTNNKGKMETAYNGGFYDSGGANEETNMTHEQSGGGFYDFDGDSDENSKAQDIAGGGFEITEHNSGSDKAKPNTETEDSRSIEEMNLVQEDVVGSNEIYGDPDTYGRCFAEFDADSDDDDDDDDDNLHSVDSNPKPMKLETESTETNEHESDSKSPINEIMDNSENYGRCFGLYDTDGDEEDDDYNIDKNKSSNDRPLYDPKGVTSGGKGVDATTAVTISSSVTPNASDSIVGGFNLQLEQSSSRDAEKGMKNSELMISDPFDSKNESSLEPPVADTEENEWSDLSDNGNVHDDVDNDLNDNNANNDAADYEFEYSDSE